MNLKEIINRQADTSGKIHYSQEELEYVVASYIKDRKGVGVDINIAKGLNPQNIMSSFILQNQLQMLDEAFKTAKSWYLKNEQRG